MVRDNGFANKHRNDRSDAMWLAQNVGATVGLSHSNLTHPHHIRTAYNAYLAGEREADEAQRTTKQQTA